MYQNLEFAIASFMSYIIETTFIKARLLLKLVQLTNQIIDLLFDGKSGKPEFIVY